MINWYYILQFTKTNLIKNSQYFNNNFNRNFKNFNKITKLELLTFNIKLTYNFNFNLFLLQKCFNF